MKLIYFCIGVVLACLLLAFIVNNVQGVSHCYAMGIAKTGKPWVWSGYDRVCEMRHE